eukprot:2438886-Rhodomonas_salina.1
MGWGMRMYPGLTYLAPLLLIHINLVTVTPDAFLNTQMTFERGAGEKALSARISTLVNGHPERILRDEASYSRRCWTDHSTNFCNLSWFPRRLRTRRAMLLRGGGSGPEQTSLDAISMAKRTNRDAWEGKAGENELCMALDAIEQAACPQKRWHHQAQKEGALSTEQQIEALAEVIERLVERIEEAGGLREKSFSALLAAIVLQAKRRRPFPARGALPEGGGGGGGG